MASKKPGPCDYLKSQVYLNKPTTISQLKENINEEISAVPRSMRQRVFQRVRN